MTEVHKHETLPRNKKRSATTALLTESIVQHLEPHYLEILDSVIKAAKEGDPAAQKMVLQYFPVPRSPDPLISIPGLKGAKTLEEKGEAIMTALASSELGFDGADRAMKLLASYATIITASTFEARLKALEATEVIENE